MISSQPRQNNEISFEWFVKRGAADYDEKLPITRGSGGNNGPVCCPFDVQLIQLKLLSRDDCNCWLVSSSVRSICSSEKNITEEREALPQTYVHTYVCMGLPV
jgi:hypothetical protein